MKDLINAIYRPVCGVERRERSRKSYEWNKIILFDMMVLKNLFKIYYSLSFHSTFEWINIKTYKVKM